MYESSLLTPPIQLLLFILSRVGSRCSGGEAKRQNPFETLKEKISNAPVLALPISNNHLKSRLITFNCSQSVVSRRTPCWAYHAITVLVWNRTCATGLLWVGWG
nr:hypothetical protein Q903MT_gene2788 [Picea sitchensis]